MKSVLKKNRLTLMHIHTFDTSNKDFSSSRSRLIYVDSTYVTKPDSPSMYTVSKFQVIMVQLCYNDQYMYALS